MKKFEKEFGTKFIIKAKEFAEDFIGISLLQTGKRIKVNQRKHNKNTFKRFNEQSKKNFLHRQS